LKQKLTILSLVLLVALSVTLLDACKKSGDDTGGPVNPGFNPTYIKLQIPTGWPTPGFDIYATNPLTEEGFQLGKKLFYDGRLSKDGNFPCASCHQQFAAFATYDHDLSHGFNNAFTTRNAPGTFNLAWMKEMHWDGGINHIEVQPLAPITAPNEMAESVDSVLFKLKKDTTYIRMFKAAFEDGTINSQHLLKALAQYMGSIISSNSKYDKVQRGEASFTSSELAGYNVFKAKCASCHKEPLFTDNSYRNNGLPINTFFNDFGRMRITGLRSDSLKFKVPTLRNAALTFPYMHDGRFITLGQVIEHYRTSVIPSATLDPLLSGGITMTSLEKSNLILFISTLTDNEMTSNPRFAQ
jgi:cytochrome c peroxidase